MRQSDTDRRLSPLHAVRGLAITMALAFAWMVAVAATY
jgi:hypothetical protein